MTRYRIARSRFWAPALLLVGATDDRSFLEIDETRIVAQLGWKRIEIPRRDIGFAEPSSWPWWGGIGWRSDLRHSIGLIGALSPIVRIHHRPQRTTIVGIPITTTDLYLSVDDPAAVVRDLSSR